MFGALKALAAASIVLSACASTGVEDELAGETAEDSALDGKADGAVDGAYTYFEIYSDFRKCAAPMCGGFYLHRLNRSSTVCHNGANRWSCYVPQLDFSQSDLGADLQAAVRDAANRDALSSGVVAIVRGRFAPQQYTGFGNLGRFVVTEAWVAENDSVSEGVFAKVKDSGVRCITTPCPSIVEKALNTSRSANIHGLDWSAGGFDGDQLSKLAGEMVGTPHGILIAGDRYTFTENGQRAKGRTVTAAYRRLVDQTCYVGGCSGQICSDREGVISTCEWREEYACYQTATCERQFDGQCGWTPTPELDACLADN
jgi:eight-cysteine-cluster-containing protein